MKLSQIKFDLKSQRILTGIIVMSIGIALVTSSKKADSHDAIALSPIAGPEEPSRQTPGPVAPPTPVVVQAVAPVTWQDNPNKCDTSKQWIAKEAPFACLPKTAPKKPVNTAHTSTVQSVNVAAYSELPGVNAAVGAAYVYGTAGPRTFDCSGLTSYLSKLRGYSISRSSATQIATLKHISLAEAVPGDIIAFNSRHVGMYLGDNKVIHALNPRMGVRIEALSYATKYNGFMTVLAVGH